MSGSSLTFDQVIKAQKSHTTGFDYLRVGLALAVLCIHVINISDHALWVWLWKSWFAPVYLSVLPAFFVLSGFLVTGSLFRNSIPQFLALRALRIFPALAVEVTMSAIVLGLLVTQLPTRAYLVSPEFHAYFLNVVGDIHFTLPGVFSGRPINLQLWTIPFELECYICLVVLALVGLVSRPRLFGALVTIAVLLATAVALERGWYHKGWNVPGRMLVLSFIFGVLIYLFKKSVPYSRFICVTCASATYVFLSMPNLTFLAAGPLAYITIYVGLMRPPRIPFGDLSYGVYLFHFPIARSIFELTGRRMAWELLLPLTVVLTACFAALSWNLIEKPILDRKSRALAIVASVTGRISDRLPRFSRPGKEAVKEETPEPLKPVA
jgi:peptidoglycan/LPS O-acetylase OafA/YrhL